MYMKIYGPLFGLVFAGIAIAADSVPRLKATLSIGGEHRFVLLDQNGKSSDFLSAGESFDGYTIKGYDKKSGLVELTREGRTMQVALIPDAPTKTVSPAESRRILESLAEMMKPSGMRRVNDTTTHLMIGGKSVRVGTRFIAQYNQQSYELELVSADEKTYKLRFQGEEIVRPIK